VVTTSAVNCPLFTAAGVIKKVKEKSLFDLKLLVLLVFEIV